MLRPFPNSGNHNGVSASAHATIIDSKSILCASLYP
jgi:hypothetical protein